MPDQEDTLTENVETVVNKLTVMSLRDDDEYDTRLIQSVLQEKYDVRATLEDIMDELVLLRARQWLRDNPAPEQPVRMNAIPIVTKDIGHGSKHCSGCGETNITVQRYAFRASDTSSNVMNWCPVCLHVILKFLQKDEVFHD